MSLDPPLVKLKSVKKACNKSKHFLAGGNRREKNGMIDFARKFRRLVDNGWIITTCVQMGSANIVLLVKTQTACIHGTQKVQRDGKIGVKMFKQSPRKVCSFVVVICCVEIYERVDKYESHSVIISTPHWNDSGGAEPRGVDWKSLPSGWIFL